MNTGRRPLFRAAAALGLVAILATAGCAADSPKSSENGSPDSSSTAPDTTPEKEKISVAIQPSSQFAPMYYGIESGIFEKNGLEVEVVPQTDTAAIISGLASGQYDFGFGTVVHVVMANVNGIPIRTVSTIEGQLKPDDQGTVTIASKTSGINETKDLAGKRIAIIALSGINTLTTWSAVEAAGVDRNSIELIQMPFGQMPAALESGDVDAAVMQWPFAGDALNAGGKVLFYNNAAFFANTATTVLNTSETFIKANPNTTAAFAKSMIESIQAASSNPEEAKDALVTGMGMSEESAKVAKWNIGGVPYVSIDAFNTVQEMLIKYTSDSSVVEALKKVDVSQLVYPGALEG